ncbi:hypothetical protein [Natrinema thermotolerans]
MSGKTSGPGRGVVFECQNEPGIAKDQRTKLTVDGIAAVDWNTEWTWDETKAESSSQDNAERAFELMQQLNEHGGYGVVYTKSFNDVAIGRATPGCLYFDKVRVGPGNETLKKLKTIRFDEWGIMEREEFKEDFDRVYDAFLTDGGNQLHPNHIQTMAKIDDTTAVTEAFAQLDLAGRLQTRE